MYMLYGVFKFISLPLGQEMWRVKKLLRISEQIVCFWLAKMKTPTWFFFLEKFRIQTKR